MTFSVEGYEIDGDSLVSEHPLADATAEELAAIVGLEDVDEIYAGAYRLSAEMLDKIVSRYSIVLTGEPQQYFLSSYSD